MSDFLLKTECNTICDNFLSLKMFRYLGPYLKADAVRASSKRLYNNSARQLGGHVTDHTQVTFSLLLLNSDYVL